MNQEQFKLQRVWQALDIDLTEEIVSFWVDNKALPSREAAAARVGQVVYVARSSSGQISAVTTAYLQHSEQLNNHFYYMRVFVADASRRSQLGIELLRKVQSYFESLYQQGMLSPAIGLLMEVENPLLKKARNEAVWPTTNFVYIGNNAKGDHQRVYYFDGARIN